MTKKQNLLTGTLNFASYKGMIYLTFDWSTWGNHCFAIFSDYHKGERKEESHRDILTLVSGNHTMPNF